jgi:hypothetical protein
MSFVLALLAAGPADTDALAQMRAGKMLCAYPDEAERTCTSIDSFEEQTDGSFIATGEVLLPGDEGLSIQIPSTVRVEDGMICGKVVVADMQKGTVRMNGVALPADRNVAVLGKLIERMKSMAGRTVCEVLQVQDDQLMKFGQIDGADINLPGKPVQWIVPAEGYRVAPR